MFVESIANRRIARVLKSGSSGHYHLQSHNEVDAAADYKISRTPLLLGADKKPSRSSSSMMFAALL